MSFAEDYVELQADALEMINDAGRTVTVKKLDRTSADSAKPWRSPGATVTTWSCKAVFVELSSAVKLGMTMDVDELVKRNGRCLLLPASPSTPDLLTYDIVVDGSEELRILRGQVLKPGDTVMGYFLEVAQ